MSLSVKLKQFKIARTKGEKLAKVEFRGKLGLVYFYWDGKQRGWSYLEELEAVLRK